MYTFFWATLYILGHNFAGFSLNRSLKLIITEIGSVSVDWIEMTQLRAKWRALVIKIKKHGAT